MASFLPQRGRSAAPPDAVTSHPGAHFVARDRATDVTVFIAEDNPILLQGLARALEANGYAVEVAEDGLAMLELLAGAPAPPDLLLLDVMMPGMGGLEVLRTLREDPLWSSLPVMLITAASDEEFPRSARESGAADVLIKPFRLSDLLERIDANVRKARATAAAPPARG